MQKQPLHKKPRIRTDRQIRPDIDFMQLIFINVYHDLIGRSCEPVKVVARLQQIHPRSNGQEKIGILLHKISVPLPHAARPAKKKRMILFDQINPVPCRKNRYAKLIRQLTENVYPIRQADSAARQQHGARRLIQSLNHLKNLTLQQALLPGLFTCADFFRLPSNQLILVNLRCLYV